MYTLVFSSQKGGVAKTETARAFASGLARRGHRVLAVDSDPQANLTVASGIMPMQADMTLYDIYERTAGAEDTIQATAGGYDIIPGDLRLTTADLKYSGRAGREYRLKRALKPLQGQYDYCVVDTPPNIGLLTENAFLAAQGIIIPVCPDLYSLQGLSQLADLLEVLRTDLEDMDAQVAGVLLTRLDDRKRALTGPITDQIQVLARNMGTRLFRARIREAAVVQKSALAQKPLWDYDAGAEATRDYEEAVDEFLEGR